MTIVKRSVVVVVLIASFLAIRGAADRAPAQSSTTVDIAVARTSDDAEEAPSGAVNLSSSDLELVESSGNQTVGLRFAQLTVPRSATIVESYVQFEVDKATSDPTDLVVQGQASGNAPTFTTATRDVSARPRTVAVAMWRPLAWTVVQAHGVEQRTPDLSTVVAEITGRGDWASGNALVVILTGTGKRVAESFNGSAAPVLHVVYSSDAPSPTTTATTTTTTTPTTTTTTTITTTAPTTTMAPTTTTTTPSTSTTSVASAEPPGSFRAVCKISHQAQVDPIVAPGTVSAHLHDFFGNRSTSAISTYPSMLAATTTCTNPLDRAAYWSPSLISPSGTIIKPTQAVFYYRNRPTDYGRTVAFPPDFRMIAGGMTSFPNSYWTCDGDSDTAFTTRTSTIPNCGTKGKVKLHVFFPSCWDGQHIDASDHRSHVAYGLDDHGQVDGTNPDTCPPGFPVKVPQLDFRVLFPVGNAAGYHLSDGEQLAHSDFWNTWTQSELERLVETCLRGGKSCGES